jgi:enediyne polyketide synthase
MQLNTDDIVLATAGAKGITAECVLALAKKNTQAKFVLVGRSAAGDDSVQTCLNLYHQQSIFCKYHSCDITDKLAVAKLVTELEQSLGKITVFIHGAGLNTPRPLKTVSRSQIHTEIAPKLKGLQNFLKVLNVQNLKMVVGFSSIIAFTGMRGNAWYSWANSMLEKLLQHYQAQYLHIDIRTIAYSVWDEVGMGVRMGSVKQLKKNGINAIPKQQGKAAFLQLINSANTPAHTIVAANIAGLNTWQPMLASQKPIDNQDKVDIKQPVSHTHIYRFIDKIISLVPGQECISQVHLSLTTDLYLIDHCFNGSYLFPSVFGLEAMAQVAACVMQLDELPTPILIENIKLSRPIVVDAQQGLTIQIQAKVIDAAQPQVAVVISTAHTNFSLPYFSAQFSWGSQQQDLNDLPHIADQPLSIQPSSQLYGCMLFQGQRFQRIDKLYSLDEKSVSFSISAKPLQLDTYATAEPKFILGDPYARDTLLQSTQIYLTPAIWLPIEINNIKIISIDNKNIASLAYAQQQEKNDQLIIANVTKFNPTNTIVESISGYKCRIIEHKQDLPSVAKLLQQLQDQDKQVFHNIINKVSQQADIVLPIIGWLNITNLIQQDKTARHTVAEKLFQQTYKVVCQQDTSVATQPPQLAWDDTGKPYLDKHNTQLDVSFSHDDQVCLCSLASWRQGCDIEPIVRRSRQAWLSILGSTHKELFDNLENKLEQDIAATHIWCALEVAKKTNLFSLEQSLRLSVDSNESNYVLFAAQQGDIKLQLVSIVIKLPNTTTRIFACALEQPLANLENLPAAKEIMPELFSYKIRGKYGEERYVHRFRTTFKDANNLDKSLCFSTYAQWMGQLRELPLLSIAQPLIKDLTSGEWGMITNHSNLTIIDQVDVFDLIEGQCWAAKAYGKYKSTVDFKFEWYKVDTQEHKQLIAYTNLSITWVKVIGHGKVETQPFPQYFQQWVDERIVQNYAMLDQYQEEKPQLQLDRVIKKFLYLPQAINISYSRRFTTSLDEANLIGNIYYSYYYQWMAKTFDLWAYNFFQDIYNSSSPLEHRFVCSYAQLDHLREAMPFDKIVVDLSIQAIYNNGLELSYTFYRLENSNKIKLAIGKRTMIYVAINNNTSQTACFTDDIISKLMNHEK